MLQMHVEGNLHHFEKQKYIVIETFETVSSAFYMSLLSFPHDLRLRVSEHRDIRDRPGAECVINTRKEAPETEKITY
jgi:hypothetical protein